jgi:tRNA(fMet)-specific endonuclease VapC
VILDTNALSAFAEGHQQVRDSIIASSGPYLPVVVIGEYRFGVMTVRDRQRRLAWLAELMEYWQVLEVSVETATHYAEIRQKLKLQATPIPANDTWIAALARQHQLPIMSNDLHFDVVPGIERIGF